MKKVSASSTATTDVETATSNIEYIFVEEQVLNEPVEKDQIPPEATSEEMGKADPVVDKPANGEATQDDVMVTTEKQNPPPSTYNVLSKVFAKDKPLLQQKPAPTTRIELEEKTVTDLHQHYETLLVQNREQEDAWWPY